MVACPKCGSRGLGNWGGDTFCIHCGMRPSIQLDDIDLLDTRSEANPIGVGGGTVEDKPYRFAVIEIETDEGRALLKIFYIVEILKRHIRPSTSGYKYQRTERYEGAPLCDIATMRAIKRGLTKGRLRVYEEELRLRLKTTQRNPCCI